VDGPQALENALRDGWSYDLLLLAVTLPDAAGEAALALARRSCPATPVIVLSGPMAVEQTLACLRLGATDCVPRAGLPLLVPVVRRALEEARRASAEREAQAANRRLAALLRATLEATEDGVLVTDLAGKITTYNRKFMTLCGIPEYVMAPMELERVLQFLLDQFQDPEAFLAETRRLAQRPDGEGSAILTLKGDRVFEESSRPHRVGQQTVGRIYSFRDITEREKSAAQLRQQASLGQTLLAGAQAGRAVPWAAPDGDLVLPEYAAQLLGLTAADLPRDLAGLEALIHPEDRDRLREALERPAHESFEARVRQGGDWLRTRWSLGRSAEGGFGGVFLDISQEEAERGKAAVGLRARWLGSFAANMAQTLRPDLEGLEAALAGLGEAAPTAARGFLDSLKATLAAMDPVAPGAPGPLLDLNALLERLRPWAEAELGAGIQLLLEPRPVPSLPLNPARMEPVLMNLLLNARDALDGAGEIRVRTGVLKHGRGGDRGVPVFLEVEDDGPGVPPRVRERMFDPFFTTRPGRRGLGLTVVRNIVESCGGTLEVATGAKAGTTVRVILPG